MTNAKVKDFGKVLVLMGGWSAEREISLNTGDAVLKALKENNVDCEGFDLTRENLEALQRIEFDRAFIALHGVGGEDGFIQNFLESLNIPYTGSDASASAICINKAETKSIWRDMGIPTPDYVISDSNTLEDSVIETIQLPVVIKPVFEGSSIGIRIVRNQDQISPAIENAMSYGKEVLVESFVQGSEYTVGILQGNVLPMIRLEPSNEFYDYDAKYHSHETLYHCPCGLEAEVEDRIATLALKSFSLTGATGWGRVDLMMDEFGKPWFIEVNTVPGMTDHSLVPMAAKQAGISFQELVLEILTTSLNKNARK